MRRRSFLRLLATAIYLPLAPLQRWRRPPPKDRLTFSPIGRYSDDRIHVAAGHRATPLIRWGDPLFSDAPAFDPAVLTAAAQGRQFGYNCDYVGYLPLPAGSDESNRGLLTVHHEYTNPELMFLGYDPAAPTREQVDVQLAAHGISIVEVARSRTGDWSQTTASSFNRRITATTPLDVTGPAAGHMWLRTEDYPRGTTVPGTLANCSAGITPWGTVLSAEENFHLYFGRRDRIDDGVIRSIHGRYGVPRRKSYYGFETQAREFDLVANPTGPFAFGWVVETDPYDANWKPRKRTALGRIRREGATCVVAPSGRVAVYSGEDIAFEYVYKFVTRDAYDPGRRERNLDLLDHGTLYAARFDHDGTGLWLPLVHGVGPLKASNGFDSQGDVVMDVLDAADRMVPTRMDRPEDIKVSPRTGRVYIALTSNVLRGEEGYLGPDPSNPRPVNRHGHIIELTEQGGDHAALRFSWRVFMLCGEPTEPDTYFAGFPKALVDAISRPDNLTFDRLGNLWVATDGQART
ncbi:MAG: PhoX family phosphatase, partial [Anaerolineae bacterium]